MKILVTGGTGFIGSHTSVELLNRGYDIIIADNLSNSHIEVTDAIKKITGKSLIFEKVELCNPDEVKNLFLKHNDIKAVIHFAAFKSVGESVQFPLKYYHNNIASVVNLLNSMMEFDVRNIVYSSSCTVYGQPDILPVRENSPILKAASPYGNSKKICEDIIEDTTKTSAIKAIALRYFNPIGAHDSALIGELPTRIPDNLVPYITQTAIGIREYLRVFGSDYDTPDGTAVRDYIHVVDLAKAHIVALERLLNDNKSRYEYFNLGTGHGFSVLDVIKAFEKVSGQKLNYKIVDRRPGDIEKIWADTSLSNKELKWKAEETLESMMLSAWNWEKKLKLKA